MLASPSPPLSVLMPVRNGMPHLTHAVIDLLAGMAGEDELLVVDDGSEDATPVFLAHLASEDSRVHVVRTSGHGLVSALNLGLAEVRHEWVARADADDRYPIQRLQLQRQSFNPGVVLVTGDYRLRSNQQDLGVIPCALESPFVLASLLHPQRVPHPGTAINRVAAVSAGGYQPEDFPAEDLGLWLRLSREGSLLGIPYETVSWTMHASSITHSQRTQQRAMTHQLLDKLFPTDLVAPRPDDVMAEIHRYTGTEWGDVRTLLLARDLRALSRRGVGLPAYRTASRHLLKSPLSTTRSGLQIAGDKIRRDRVRSSFTRTYGVAS